MFVKKTTLFMLTLAFGLAACVAGCGPSSKAESPKPERIVENFHGWYLDYPGNAMVDGAFRSNEYLAPEYVKKVDEIIASFDRGGYDPFLCAQDAPAHWNVGKAVVVADTATVDVRQIWNPETEYEQNREITVTVKKVDGAWKINDIQCSLPDPVAQVTGLPRAASPEEAVQGFYDWYLDSSAYVEQTGERLNPLVDGRYRSNPYLTDGLVQKVEAIVDAFDKGGFDPFLCAQDVPDSLSFEEPVVSGDVARVVIRTSFEGHAFTVALFREAGAWKMSDVLCEVNEVEETSFEGWQTFSDEGCAFQLRYPPSWTYEELELRPPAETPDAEKALKRLLVFQPQGWDGVAPPLHIQVTQGTAEEFSLLHVPPSATEDLTINGKRVVKAVEALESGLEVTRYVFTSPTDATIRIVLLDYISGFPERLTDNKDVAQLLQEILSSLKFTN